MLHITQVDWFNYVSLLQRKVSNHEVSVLCIISLGFCCVHRNWPHQPSVRTGVMPTKQMHIRSHDLSAKRAWLVLNLLKSRNTIASLQWSIAYDAFPLWQSRKMLNVWKQYMLKVTNLSRFFWWIFLTWKRILLQFTI